MSCESSNKHQCGIHIIHVLVTIAVLIVTVVMTLAIQESSQKSSNSYGVQTNLLLVVESLQRDVEILKPTPFASAEMKQRQIDAVRAAEFQTIVAQYDGPILGEMRFDKPNCIFRATDRYSGAVRQFAIHAATETSTISLPATVRDTQNSAILNSVPRMRYLSFAPDGFIGTDGENVSVVISGDLFPQIGTQANFGSIVQPSYLDKVDIGTSLPDSTGHGSYNGFLFAVAPISDFHWVMEKTGRNSLHCFVPPQQQQ